MPEFRDKYLSIFLSEMHEHDKDARVIFLLSRIWTSLGILCWTCHLNQYFEPSGSTYAWVLISNLLSPQKLKNKK
jgi:hypothetical protein